MDMEWKWCELIVHGHACDQDNYPDSKVHEANMGPTWVLSAPGGPHVGHINLAMRVGLLYFTPAKTAIF